MLGIKKKIQLYLLIFLYLGYFMYILNRRSFAFLVSTIIKKEGIGNDEVGVIISSLAFAYAVGKFGGGILVDKSSPRLLLAVGLFGTGIANLIFSFSSPSWFPLLWFFNGLFQGPGWPACARIIRRWYSSEVFGTLWGGLSTSMNVAAGVGPLISSFLLSVNNDDWRIVMQLCGTVSCGYALALFLLIKDKPEDVGLSLDMLSENDKKPSKTKPLSSKPSSQNNTKSDGLTTFKRIFSSFYMYALSYAFLIAMFTKGIISDWGPIYLIQEKGATNYVAGLFTASVEIGGLIGTLVSGYVSDKFVASFGMSKYGHPRHYVFVFCFFVTSVGLAALTTVTATNTVYLTLLGFFIGFGIYSALSLCGVLAIELASEDIAGTTHACCAVFGNVGFVLSGFPFSNLVSNFGWTNALYFCDLFPIITFLLFIFLQKCNCRIGAEKDN